VTSSHRGDVPFRLPRPAYPRPDGEAAQDRFSEGTRTRNRGAGRNFYSSASYKQAKLNSQNPSNIATLPRTVNPLDRWKRVYLLDSGTPKTIPD